jgi:hypothetical protein
MMTHGQVAQQEFTVQSNEILFTYRSKETLMLNLIISDNGILGCKTRKYVPVLN